MNKTTTDGRRQDRHIHPHHICLSQRRRTRCRASCRNHVVAVEETGRATPRRMAWNDLSVCVWIYVVRSIRGAEALSIFAHRTQRQQWKNRRLLTPPYICKMRVFVGGRGLSAKLKTNNFQFTDSSNVSISNCRQPKMHCSTSALYLQKISWLN